MFYKGINGEYILLNNDEEVLWSKMSSKFAPCVYVSKIARKIYKKLNVPEFEIIILWKTDERKIKYKYDVIIEDLGLNRATVQRYNVKLYNKEKIKI